MIDAETLDSWRGRAVKLLLGVVIALELASIFGVMTDARNAWLAVTPIGGATLIGLALWLLYGHPYCALCGRPRHRVSRSTALVEGVAGTVCGDCFARGIPVLDGGSTGPRALKAVRASLQESVRSLAPTAERDVAVPLLWASAGVFTDWSERKWVTQHARRVHRPEIAAEMVERAPIAANNDALFDQVASYALARRPSEALARLAAVEPRSSLERALVALNSAWIELQDAPSDLAAVDALRKRAEAGAAALLEAAEPSTRPAYQRICAEMRAEFELALGRAEETVSSLQALESEAPLSSSAAELLGRALASLGRTAEARACWERLLETCPKDSALAERITTLVAALPVR